MTKKTRSAPWEFRGYAVDLYKKYKEMVDETEDWVQDSTQTDERIKEIEKTLTNPRFFPSNMQKASGAKDRREYAELQAELARLQGYRLTLDLDVEHLNQARTDFHSFMMGQDQAFKAAYNDHYSLKASQVNDRAMLILNSGIATAGDYEALADEFADNPTMTRIIASKAREAAGTLLQSKRPADKKTGQKLAKTADMLQGSVDRTLNQWNSLVDTLNHAIGNSAATGPDAPAGLLLPDSFKSQADRLRSYKIPLHPAIDLERMCDDFSFERSYVPDQGYEDMAAAFERLATAIEPLLPGVDEQPDQAE